MLRLGIVSDLHGNLGNSKKIARRLKGKIDILVIAGDITGNFSPFISGRAVLRSFRDIEVPTFVIPGSHEPVNIYEDIMTYFLDFHDCTQEHNRVKSVDGYDLLFLPGSNWNSELGGFRIYENKEKLKENIDRLPNRNWRFFFIDELEKYLRNPDKTVLISHIPPKFEGADAIDRAEFIEVVSKEGYEERYKPGSDELEEQKEGVKVKEKEENVGSEELREFIEESGIKKLVCGHIHEAGGKAQRLDGSPVKEGEYSEEIFYNVGAGTEGKAGILILEGKKAKYSKIQV